MLGETNMANYDLEDAVMMLHNVARTIEREIGFGTLAQNIRESANRLTTLIRPIKVTDPE
jgi:hypothetical protein